MRWTESRLVVAYADIYEYILFILHCTMRLYTIDVNTIRCMNVRGEVRATKVRWVFGIVGIPSLF